MRHPDRPPGYNHYSVRVLNRKPEKINVLCPVCRKGFEIAKYGIVKCPKCKSKLEYKERT